MALRHVIAMVLVGFAPGVVHAQGLAQAAKKAQEQSEATAGRGTAVTRLSMSPLDGDLEEIQLTMDLLQQYGQARASIGREFDRDIPMYNRVDDAMRKVSTARGVPRVRSRAEAQTGDRIQRALGRVLYGPPPDDAAGGEPGQQQLRKQASRFDDTAPGGQHGVHDPAQVGDHRPRGSPERSRSWQFVWPPMSRVKY